MGPFEGAGRAGGVGLVIPKPVQKSTLCTIVGDVRLGGRLWGFFIFVADSLVMPSRSMADRGGGDWAAEMVVATIELGWI